MSTTRPRPADLIYLALCAATAAAGLAAAVALPGPLGLACSAACGGGAMTWALLIGQDE